MGPPELTTLVSLLTAMAGLAVFLRADNDRTRRELREELRLEIRGVRSELGVVRNELRTDMGALRDGLRTDIASLRTEVKSDIQRLDDRLFTLSTSLKPLVEQAERIPRD